MAPIPTYSHSPIISAAKAADGATPQTADKSQGSPPPPTTTQGPACPPARPGAVPSMPAPTGSVSLPHLQPTPLQPTPTQPLTSQGPALPQPGAFPVPPGASTSPPAASQTSLPPPPKAGESLPQAQAQPQVYYPPQMSIPAPAASATQGAQRGTSTAFVAAPSPVEHPPGYQQNPNAGELDQHQRAAQEALEQEEEEKRRALGGTSGDREAGVWGSVKGAMMAAGEKIGTYPFSPVPDALTGSFATR